MAGLACGEVSLPAWRLLREGATDVMAIPDRAAVDALRRFASPAGDDPTIEAGESGAAGLASLLAALADPLARAALGLDGHSRVLLVNSEGATDPEIYRALTGAPTNPM